MSENRICNYCSLQSVRRDAKKKKKRVVVKPSEFDDALGGMDVHLLNKNEKPTAKNKIYWFWEITSGCVC